MEIEKIGSKGRDSGSSYLRWIRLGNPSDFNELEKPVAKKID
jgi:hypothetical protein